MQRSKRQTLVIFDLDGTLVDSKADLCHSVNYVREQFGLDHLDDQSITAMIGNGAMALVEQALADAPGANSHDGLAMFLDNYREHMLDRTRLYEGVPETLEALSQCHLAVLTNKPYRFSCRMLEGLGILRRFSVVYGGNSFDRKKPDPIGIRQILVDTGATRGATWMVGDSSVDVQTGRAAGVRTLGVSYGYAAHTFVEHPPDRIVDEFPAIPSVVR